MRMVCNYGMTMDWIIVAHVIVIALLTVASYCLWQAAACLVGIGKRPDDDLNHRQKH